MSLVHNKSLKEKAMDLRRGGKTYSEILALVPVAKSTLSLWLSDVGLSKKQKQRITLKKLQAGLRGGLARKLQRIKISEEIKTKAENEIGRLSKRELWLIGAALYWAEGSKEKDHSPGSGVTFGNSDSRMICLFLRWLQECCKVEKDRIRFEIYIHENFRNDLERVKKYWSLHIAFDTKYFSHVYFKRHKPKTNRTNVGDLYYGVLRVKVSSSSELNRRISGWIQGIEKNCRIV